MVTVLPTVLLYPNLALNVVGTVLGHAREEREHTFEGGVGRRRHHGQGSEGHEQRQDESQDPRAGTHADNPERAPAVLVHVF